MDDRETQEAAIRKLVSLMYSKGYRSRCSMAIAKGGRPIYHGDLRQCLAHFFKVRSGREARLAALELETHAPSNHRITCRMTMAYAEDTGFSIRGVDVRHARTRERKHFSLRSNHELPGAMTLESMFPKPKPWDWMLKGKFRP